MGADPLWTFERGCERLTVCRRSTSALRLIITTNGTPHTYRFADIGELIAFQNDVEGCLVQSGWSFVAFSPERRTGAERRHAIGVAAASAKQCQD